MIIRKPIAALIYFILFCAVGLYADLAVDDAGLFIINYPAPVTRDVKESDTVAGHLKEITATCTDDTGNYMVVYWDYPSDRSVTNLSSFYEETLAGIVKSENLQVLSKSDCKAGEIDGLDCTAKFTTADAAIHIRIFLVGHRFYEITCIGPVNSENGKNALDFLNSFRVLR
jgi:hypothetical protein